MPKVLLATFHTEHQAKRCLDQLRGKTSSMLLKLGTFLRLEVEPEQEGELTKLISSSEGLVSLVVDEE